MFHSKRRAPTTVDVDTANYNTSAVRWSPQQSPTDISAESYISLQITHNKSHQQTDARVRTETEWFSMTFQDFFMCVFQDFPGLFTSIFHVFPGLFNRVDIKHIRFSYNTEYVTQFIIILHSRSNWVWQWTMIMYTGQKCGNHLVYFPWLSRT